MKHVNIAYCVFFARLIYVCCFLFLFHLDLIKSLFDHFLLQLVLFYHFLILLIRLKALSCLSNFSLGVLPLCLYTKSSGLNFLSNLAISLSLLSVSSLNIYFWFKINGLLILLSASSLNIYFWFKINGLSSSS